MLKDLISFGSDAFDRYTKWRNLEKDINAKIRLLYLECKRNLALLECINIDSKTDLPDLFKLMSVFETDILEMIFMDGEKGNKLFEILSKPINVDTDNEYDSPKDNTKEEKEKSKTIVQTAMFIYVRASALKKIGKPDIKYTILKNINFKLRLSNLEKALSAIVIELQKHDAIRQLVK